MSSGKKPAAAGGKPQGAPAAKIAPAAAAAVVASPIPSPAAAATATGAFVPLLPAASALVAGCTLRVTSVLGASFECVLHCYDGAAGLLVVEVAYPFDSDLAYAARPDLTPQTQAAEAACQGEGKKDFAILNASHIRAELVSRGPAQARALPPLSLPAIAAKVDENSQQRMEYVQSIGIGVAPEVQKLFDAIRKTTPCVWSGDCSSFVVMDSVRVSSPFTSSACTSLPLGPVPAGPSGPKKQATAAAAAEVMLTRVRKIVEAERTKLKLKL